MLRNTQEASVDLLIGDKPIIYTGSMLEKFTIALPLSPTLVFFASNIDGFTQAIGQYSASQLVKDLNKNMVAQAMRYVYATSVRQKPLVERYLQPPLQG